MDLSRLESLHGQLDLLVSTDIHCYDRVLCVFIITGNAEMTAGA